MGVALPKMMVALPKLSPSYGFHGTGAAMDSVRKAMNQGMELIAELAEIEVGLFRLIAEIKKTLKRLNALENIYIPLYESTVKYMEENLEEKEREFLFQLKRQKKRRKEKEHGKFDKILVSVDDSKYSLAAARLAARIAKFHGSQVKLFHVLDTLLVDKLKSFSKRDISMLYIPSIPPERRSLPSSGILGHERPGPPAPAAI